MPPIDALKVILDVLRGNSAGHGVTAIFTAVLAVLKWAGETFLPQRATAGVAADGLKAVSDSEAAEAIDAYVAANKEMFASADGGGTAVGNLPNILPILLPVILRILERLFSK